MLPWRYLNFKGKALIVACIINILCMIVFVQAQSYMCIFSGVMAMVCGLSTYNKKYQKQSAGDINNEI
jgi:hypothetical protein